MKPAAAPIGVTFELPNGEMSAPCGPGHWVLESLCGPHPTLNGKMVTIGVGADEALMPIGDVNQRLRETEKEGST